MDPQLWAWVDRVIYDSQSWSDFRAQMQRVETAQADAKQRIVLCDLNWTRLVQIRLAIAQFFDHPAPAQRFDEIESVEIDFAPGYRSTALLLGGWLAGATAVDGRGKRRAIRSGFRERAGEDDQGFIAGKGGRTDQPLRGWLRTDRVPSRASQKARSARRRGAPAGRNEAPDARRTERPGRV